MATYLAHALALSALHGPGPWPDGGAPLPDAAPDGQRPPLSTAVSDGLRTSRAGGPTGDPEALLLAHQIEALVREPADAETMLARLRRLHDDAAACDPLRVVDELIALTTKLRLPDDRVRDVGRWLAENGTRRGAVAVGLGLLHPGEGDRDRDLVLLLGTLEAVSLYAAIALARSRPRPDLALFHLAQRADGWGRIHAVRRLGDTSDPGIRDWLLRGGYRNTVLDEYLVLAAATTGDLAGALAADPVDEDLLDNAGRILEKLADPNSPAPAGYITDYPGAPATIDRYLTLVGEAEPTLDRLRAVLRLAKFLHSERATQLDWLAWVWKDGEREHLWRRCRELAERPQWTAVVARALEDDDPNRPAAAIWPALELGVLARRRIHDLLRSTPNNTNLWIMLFDQAGAEPGFGIDEDLALATELLPLGELTGPPTLDHGLLRRGPLFTLDLVVSRLDTYPGKGWGLISTALRAPTVRCRAMALKALESWPSDQVTTDVADALTAARDIEPDARLQAAMARLLASWTTRT